MVRGTSPRSDAFILAEIRPVHEPAPTRGKRLLLALRLAEHESRDSGGVFCRKEFKNGDDVVDGAWVKAVCTRTLDEEADVSPEYHSPHDDRGVEALVENSVLVP